MNSNSDFQQQFAKHRDEFLENTQFNPKSLQTLFMAYHPFRWKILGVLSLGFLARIIILSNSNVIGYWVDSYCTENCRSSPSWISHFESRDFLLLLTALSTVGFCCTLIFRILFSRLSARAVSQIYDEVTWRTSRYPLEFFDRTPAGRIITRFSSDYGNIFRLFGGPLAEFFSIVFDLLSMLFLISLASFYYLIFVAIISIVYFAVYRLNRKSLLQARRSLSASRSPSVAHFAETTQGASNVRVFNRILGFRRRFEILDQYYLHQKLSTVRKLSLFSFEMNGLSALLLLITGLGAQYLIHEGKVSVGSAGVAFGFIALSGNSIQMFFEWLSQLEDALVGVERLDNYLRKPIEKGSYLPAQVQFFTEHPRYNEKDQTRIETTERLTENRAASVEFVNFSFRYGPESPWILKNLNFKINPSEKIGIVGRTGSGKTTLISNLFYFYSIENGYISIDQCVPEFIIESTLLRRVDLQTFRKSIAFIPQDPVLFRGSLRQNLDFQNLHSDSELYQTLARVGLKDWLSDRALELSMQIEERGKNLSLGERQLICMARCLLQDAPVIVMDEATSSVDPQSEELMVKATENIFAGRTQLIIAHRLSTLKKCDRILWLKDGSIFKFGKTADILAEFSHEDLEI